jgi:hypothetical protein
MGRDVLRLRRTGNNGDVETTCLPPCVAEKGSNGQCTRNFHSTIRQKKLLVLYVGISAQGGTWFKPATNLDLQTLVRTSAPLNRRRARFLEKHGAAPGVLGFSLPRFFHPETVAPPAISVSPPKLPPKKARDRDRKRGGALNVVRLRIVRSRWFMGPSSAESAAAAAPLSWERRGLCAVRAARRSSRDLPLRPRHSRKNPRDLFSYGSGSGRHNGCVKMHLVSSHGRPARTHATHFRL